MKITDYNNFKGLMNTARCAEADGKETFIYHACRYRLARPTPVLYTLSPEVGEGVCVTFQERSKGGITITSKDITPEVGEAIAEGIRGDVPPETIVKVTVIGETVSVKVTHPGEEE